MGLRISDLNFEKTFWNAVHLLNLEQKACIVGFPHKYRYTPLLTDMSLPADTVQSSKAVLLANGETVVIFSLCFPASLLFYGNSYGWNGFMTPSAGGEKLRWVSRHGKRHRFDHRLLGVATQTHLRALEQRIRTNSQVTLSLHPSRS